MAMQYHLSTRSCLAFLFLLQSAIIEHPLIHLPVIYSLSGTRQGSSRLPGPQSSAALFAFRPVSETWRRTRKWKHAQMTVFMLIRSFIL